MIPDIKELNFPKKNGKQYATLAQATANIADMGEKNITTQVKIDGEIVPDFSFDWAVEFQGEKYIMPLRIPQGAKENTSLNSTIDLTFQHWAIYQLKRWPFVTIQQIAAGTYLPDEEVATVSLNLKDFCILFGQVLEYYYGDAITIDLNPAWEYDNAATVITISHTKIWNVLAGDNGLYKLFGVRWEIKAANGNSNTVKGGERYVIRVGYPTTEVDHIFEYGFEGGLLKVERQVQSEEIRNMLKGRGGETNIPFRYFKDTDPNNKDFRPDPDWVEELANIYFPNLMPATFRSYVQGWKAAHISKYPGYTAKGEANAYAPWAYRKGYTDTKFHPVEFVADEITISPATGDKQVEILPGYSPYVKKGSSLDKYGPLPDTLDNNGDIYPTLQGTGLDIAVAVEQIESDDVAESTENDAKISNIKGATTTVDIKEMTTKRTITVEFPPFDVPDGLTANIVTGAYSKKAHYTYAYVGGDNDVTDLLVISDSPEIIAVNTLTGAERSASRIPAGRWKWKAVFKVELVLDPNVHLPKEGWITVGYESPKLQTASLQGDKWRNTFDIWVKNIWDSARQSGETDAQYSERVWKPVLGDREKNTAKVVFTSGALAVSEDYEFTIVDFPIPDTSKTWEEKNEQGGVIATHTSHWRIKLAKSDAELEATGLYVPSTQKQGKAGDRFVFIGTEMTHVPYVVDAEVRQADWLKDQLGEVKEIKPTAVVTTDRVRLNNEGKPNALINQLRVGNSLRLFDQRFFNEEGKAYETLYLQSITYTYREPTKDDAALNPDVQIVLGDEYTSSANPVSMMQSEINALQRQVGSISNIEQIVRAVGDKLYLRKDGISDRSLSPTQFFSLLTSGDFRAGLVGGAGWGFFKDENGNWVLEADRMNVRQEMSVNTLVINQAEGRGGMEVDTAAYMNVTRVDDTADGYVCYFDQKGGSVGNLFHVDDVAFCNQWTSENADLKFYKRRVTAVGVDNITLSKTDVNGTGIPAEGDNIIHFGNYTDATRQYVKVRDVVGGGYERYIEALNSVNAEGVEYYFVGKQAGQSRWFVGNKDLVPYSGDGNGSYIEYINRKFNLYNVTLSVGTTIGDQTLEDYIKSVSPPVEQEDIEDFVNNIVDPKIEGIQNQIDGVIETWFFNGVPTLTNYPASDWNTEALKIAHLGDLYYDNDTGTAYRFSQNEQGTFFWNTITDDAITKALAAAQKAQDTADGKRRVFTAQPTPPYDKGDLWVNATYPAGTTAATRDPAQGKYYNDILRCGTSRATGAFAIGNWGLSSNYTDDTLAQAAKDAADKAQADADKAKADAKAAKDRLDQWAADGVISPTEKQAIKDEIARIDADKAHITAEYTRYGLGTPTAYNNAHATYRTQLVALSATTPENITIPSNFASNQTAYYNARTAALNAIANAAKKYAENIAKQEAEKAVAGYKYLKEALGDVTTIAGGLMLSSQIRLGQHNADFTTQTTWAGHNGVYDNGRTIGSWWGGDMIDRFDANDNRLNVAGKRYATSLIRMDGTGYFVDGLFRIKKTGLEIGDTANGYGISMGMDGRLTLGNGIDINIGGNAQGLAQSISSVTNLANKLADLFTPYIGTSPKNWGEITDISKITSVKVNAGVWTDGFVSARGRNPNGGSGSGGAGKSYLSDLLDVDLGTLTSGQVLTWNGTKWTNSVLTLPDMAGYALESWVEANYYTKTEVNAKNYIKVIECFKTTEWSDIRCVSDPMTMRAFDVYDKEAGGPTLYGNVLEITGKYNHWQPQLWFEAGKGGSILHRNKTFNKNTWGEWHKLLDTHNYASVLDTAYVKKSGDTMSGKLTVSANLTMLLALYGSTDGSYIQFGHGGVGAEIGCYNGIGAYFQNDAFASLPTLCLDTNDINSAKFRYNGTKYNLWHAGNDGAGSGLDADLLDGRHREEMLRIGRMPTAATSLNDRVVSEGIDFFSWNYATAPNVNGQPSGDGAASAAAVVTFGVEYPFQICSDYYDTNKLYYRSLYNGWKAWRRFAFVDSNVASATKLQTARTLWGQSFNGTANVSGSITGVSNIIADYYYLANGSNNPYLRLTLNSHNWYVQAYIDKLFVGAGIATSMQIDINGNVGIGLASSAAPSAKLDVAGLVKASSGIQIGGTADYGWYLNSSRLVAGGGVARGVNVGSLLVSDKWADATKVPTNGIYSKGAVRIGDCTISWDSANNMLKFDKGLYSEGGVTAHGINPNSGGSGGGGKNYLSELLDVSLGTPADGQALVYRNNKWVNEAIAFLSLAGYALESWVEGNFLSVDELEEGGEIAETYLQKDGSNAANSCLSNLQRKLPAIPKTPAGTDFMLFFDGGNGYSTSVDDIWQYVKTKTDSLYLGPDGDGATEFTLYNMMSACVAGSSIVDNDRFFAASWKEAEGVSYSASDFWTYIKSKMGLAFTVDGDNVSIGCQPGTLTLNGVKINSGSAITCNSLSAQGVTAYDVTIGGPNANCVKIKYRGKTYTLQLAKLIQAGYLTA